MFVILTRLLSPFAPILLVALVVVSVLLRFSYNTQNELRAEVNNLSSANSSLIKAAELHESVAKKSKEAVENLTIEKAKESKRTKAAVSAVERLSCKSNRKEGSDNVTPNVDVLNLNAGSDVIRLLQEADGSRLPTNSN